MMRTSKYKVMKAMLLVAERIYTEKLMVENGNTIRNASFAV
jgi:hypothetical protein